MSEYHKLGKTLWLAADKLRNNMDAAEYDLVVKSETSNNRNNLKSLGYGW
jgi:hypothetical protein